MTRNHRILQRQLKDCAVEAPSAALQNLLKAVNDSYYAADAERRRMERVFKAQAKKLSQATSEIYDVLSALPDLLFRIDADGVLHNLRRCETTQSDRLLHQLTAATCDGDRSPADQFLECLDAARTSHIATSFVVRDATLSHDVYYEIRLLPIEHDDVIGIAREITAQKEAEINRELAEERLRLQAYHDPLSGLPNRALFQQHLDQAIANAERTGDQLSVLFLDLDRFKHVNDLLGHSVGDMLLQEVAARLTHRIRPDDILARMGGDEFTVLIPCLGNDKEPQAIAARLLEAIEPPFELGDHELFVSGSIGISTFPSGGRTGQLLLQHADIAMYRTKARGGRGFSLYTDGVDSKTTERIKLENNLRRALNRGEFLLHYQPFVRLSDTTIVGFEALIRWNHPEYGMIAPARFIQLTEETGLIMKLGDWVLRKACEQAAVWESRGHPMRIAVNLSAKQFDTPGLTGLVAKALSDTSLSPNLLELELTESTVINNDQSTIETLHALRGLGVRLSIDDFGTGYSSLSQLRQLPFDVLKIDRSFLREVSSDNYDLHIAVGKRTRSSEAKKAGEPTRNSIIRAIVEIAHALGLEIIAEGVETEEQRALVQKLGCDVVQGFLYSQALPHTEIDELLDEYAGKPWAKAA